MRISATDFHDFFFKTYFTCGNSYVFVKNITENVFTVSWTWLGHNLLVIFRVGGLKIMWIQRFFFFFFFGGGGGWYVSAKDFHDISKTVWTWYKEQLVSIFKRGGGRSPAGLFLGYIFSWWDILATLQILEGVVMVSLLGTLQRYIWKAFMNFSEGVRHGTRNYWFSDVQFKIIMCTQYLFLLWCVRGGGGGGGGMRIYL